MSLIFSFGTSYCVRCSYKHLFLYLLAVYLLLIVLWMTFTHYVDVLPSNPDPSAYVLTKTSHTHARDPIPPSQPSQLHTMYSVSCGHLMMWQLMQSVTLDSSWYNINQSGHLTRIVSGCGYAPNNIRRMSQTSIPIQADLHFLDSKPLVKQCLNTYNSSGHNDTHNIFPLKWNWNNRFHIVFVPSFDDIKKDYPHLFGSNVDRYPQLNRILALFIIYHCTEYKNIPQDYMMMIDPDFVFLKSLEIDTLENQFGLRLHHPLAGKYGLGGKWMKWLLSIGEKVVFADGESVQNHESGVPYILHHTDWYNLVPQWMSWISFAFSKYNGIESDMYAYIIAAYKLGLKHTVREQFMSTCMKSMDQKIHPLDDSTVFIHYCSSYKVDLSAFPSMVEKIGDRVYTFNKHWTKARRHRKTKEQQLWMIECESPVLIEVPKIDTFETYNEKGNSEYRQAYKQYQVVRTIVPMFNNALIAFKEKYCENKTVINREKKIITHEATLDNGDVLYHIVDDI
eukprot:89375_1